MQAPKASGMAMMGRGIAERKRNKKSHLKMDRVMKLREGCSLVGLLAVTYPSTYLVTRLALEFFDRVRWWRFQ